MASRKPAPPVPTPSPASQPAEVIEVAAGVFKDTCLQLLDRVNDEGLELVVTKRGVPVARVVPPHDGLPSSFGFMRGALLTHDDIVSPDPDAWGELG